MPKLKHPAFFMILFVATLLAVGNWTTPTQANKSEIGATMPTSTPIIEPQKPKDEISLAQKEEIKGVIQSYFEIRYDTLSISKPYNFQLKDFGNTISDKSDAGAFLDAELDKLALEVKYAELNHSRYVLYKYFLDFDDFIIDADTKSVTVLVTESNEIIYEISAIGNPTNPHVAQMSGLKHTIVLQKEQNLWKIVSDYYNDFLWRTLRQTKKSPKDILKRLNAIEVPSISITSNEYTEIEITSSLADDSSSHDYNRDGAAQYAQNHAFPEDYNPNYPNYDGEILGGDCTNFVSQALYEGGNVSMEIPSPLPAPDIGGYGWYLLNNMQRAAAWNYVDNFYNFVTASNNVWREGPDGYELGPVPEGQWPTGLKIGDVIQ